MAELQRQAPAGVVLPFPGMGRASGAQPAEPLPWLANRVILVITSPGAEAEGFLEKVAALARFSGARLRLADGSSRGGPFERPLARLKQRARHLGRMLGRPVETVDAEMPDLQALRQQVEDCALVCMARSARAWRPGLRERDLLRTLIALRARPVLVMGSGNLDGQGGYDSVLVPVSLGPGSAELLHWARRLAPRSPLELLHVTDLQEHAGGHRASAPPSVLERMRRRSWVVLRQRLAALAAGLGDAVPGVTHTLVHGVVPDAVGRRHIGGRHDLVVVGLGARRRWWPLPWPALAQYLARWLSGDVLVIPHSAARAETPPRGLKGQWGFWT
ncbi:MAG: universal stress protein [Comamonadaceae bacterium]|nr:universal stress protein [Comamonadaceae bacterium]